MSVVGGPAGWLVGGNGKLVMNPLKVCVQASTPINGSGGCAANQPTSACENFIHNQLVSCSVLPDNNSQ